MPIYQINDFRPQIDASAFIFETAVLIGRITVGRQASIWPFVTIRGDNEPIVIGEGSNVQESCVLHTDPGFPLTIERNVTIGHLAMLHGCTIGEGSLIGIGAVVLNGAKIGRNCLIGAKALVTEGKEIPDRSLVIGAPAKVARTLSDVEIERLHANTAGYVERAAGYMRGLTRVG
ncbi:MAG: gamma carbonic anhydrase family protein [Burkholderiaceae bacterium]